MALTRKFLSALGIEPEKIDEIITAHSETVDGLKKELETYRKDAEALPEVKRQLAEAKEAAKNSGDYDKLKKEFDDYKTEVANKETLAAKKTAVSKVAKDAGLSESGIAKVLKYTDFSTIEMDDAGNVKDGKALIKSLKEEWPEYIQTTKTEGAKTETPLGATGGKAVKTKAEILEIKDTAERQAAWRDFLAAEQQKG